MAYNLELADSIRNYLQLFPDLKIAEKKMFGGLAFMVNGKMCINASGDNLMCRFDPERTEELALKTGFLPMQMKGKVYQGYCYVEPAGFKRKKDFKFWLDLCLDYNASAKSSKK